MHEIYKGMDNAAEQIDNNFKGIQDYIIEQGGNYKGWWEKRASGKLVQYGALLKTHKAATEVWGSVYLSNNPFRIEYPIPFWDVDTTEVTLKIAEGDLGWLTQYDTKPYNKLTHTPLYTLARPRAGTNDTKVQYDYIAIGRWKEPDGWEG